MWLHRSPERLLTLKLSAPKSAFCGAILLWESPDSASKLPLNLRGLVFCGWQIWGRAVFFWSKISTVIPAALTFFIGARIFPTLRNRAGVRFNASEERGSWSPTIEVKKTRQRAPNRCIFAFLVSSLSAFPGVPCENQENFPRERRCPGWQIPPCVLAGGMWESVRCRTENGCSAEDPTADYRPMPTYSKPRERMRTASRMFLVSTIRGRRRTRLMRSKSRLRNSDQAVPRTSASTPSAAAYAFSQ